MRKTKQQPKAPEAAEASTTVGGQVLSGAAPVEHGNPSATPHNTELAVVQETDTSLIVPKDMKEAEYLAIGTRIGQSIRGAAWKIGDFVNIGKAMFGYKEYDKLSEVLELDQVYLRQCSSVAERVPAEHRHFASVERFRLMLARREKIVIEGKPPTPEPIPVMVARFNGWTQAQIRTGEFAPPALSAGSTGVAAGSPTPDEPAGAGAGVPVESTAADAALQAATAPKTADKGSMTATAIYEMARTLQIGIELLTPDRLATLSVMEQKFAVVKPLGAMCRLLSEQIRTELNKDA
jgi:hypothetical protein